SKGSECQCGIHTAEAASALRSRKTERAAKEKSTPISQIFFSTCCASTRWSPGESPAPPPLPHRSHRTPPGFRCRTRQLRRRGESPRARCAAGLALPVPARRVACIEEELAGDANRMAKGGLGDLFLGHWAEVRADLRRGRIAQVSRTRPTPYDVN